MFIADEKDFEYRFKDSGPKYLMRGPRSNFALVQFPPGCDFKAHYHEVMEENFFVLEGEIDVVVNGTVYHLKEGQLIHVEPQEIHYLINNYDRTAKLISTLAPYREVDKIEVENYTY